MRQESPGQRLESLGINTSALTRARILELWETIELVNRNGTPDVVIRHALYRAGLEPEVVGRVLRKIGRTS